MKRINYQACPICKNNSLEHHLDCVDHYATQEVFELVRCPHCGFILTQDHPDESEIGRYYDTPDYISHSDTHAGIMNQIYHLARKWMLQQKYQMICKQSGQTSGSILDIGCATGYFLEVMQQHGWNTSGVEVNASARKVAEQRLNHPIASSLFSVESETLDVITLWHVMEHLQDLSGVFQKLHQLLRKDGLLVVAVPNAQSADAAHYQAYWGAYDVPRHIWHFSADNFSLLAKTHGFRVEKIAPMPLDAFYVSMLSEKYQKNSASFLRGILTGSKAFVKAWGEPKQSSSIIYLLRKTE